MLQWKLRLASVVVEAGDTIDFIVDCLEHNTSDSFQWPVKLTLTTSDGVARSFSSATEFYGPPEPVNVIVGQVTHAWQLAYCRQPEVDELVAAMSFLAGQMEYLQAHREQIPAGLTGTQQAMVDLCQVLLTSNEFLYVK
jgi:hypothetical protein